MIHYIIARRDLSLGVTAAQVTHAAGESFAVWASNQINRGGRWLNAHTENEQWIWVPKRLEIPKETIAVVLGVSGEQQLRHLENRLFEQSIAHVAIREPDAPWNGALMTIGLLPVKEKLACLSRYKLL